MVASFGYYGWYYEYVRAEPASVGSKEALKAKFFGVEECVCSWGNISSFIERSIELSCVMAEVRGK